MDFGLLRRAAAIALLIVSPHDCNAKHGFEHEDEQMPTSIVVPDYGGNIYKVCVQRLASRAAQQLLHRMPSG